MLCVVSCWHRVESLGALYLSAHTHLLPAVTAPAGRNSYTDGPPLRNEMRLYSFRFGCVLAILSLASISWIISIPSNEGSAAPDLQTLYRRLLAAEEQVGQMGRDFRSIVERLKNMSRAANATNSTNSTNSTNATQPSRNISTANSTETIGLQSKNAGPQMFLQPNIYLYLPHLRLHPDSLLPNVLLGQGRRGVSIVLGIPTVKREKQSYLISTLGSLFYSLTASQQQDLLVIVFVAEADSDYVASIAETIKTNFPKQVQSGLLEVVSPHQHYYPDFTLLRETFGDSKDRVKWRTKQNLDFSFLMLYAHDKGRFYVQLEDDVVAKAGYFNNMKTFATLNDSEQWLFLEFSQLGFIGKLFRTGDLPMVTEFFLMFHKDKPVDWLLDHILWVKACNPEKDAHCTEQKALHKKGYKPSLFQHVGLHSSLSGKVQYLKDKDFGKQTLYQVHSNPAAEVSSSLKHYQQHSLERAYTGKDFFWALTPIKNDYILFNFSQPINITRYLFRSGNVETSADKFYNTTVEVLPSNASARDTRVAAWPSYYRESDKGFIIIGAFVDGLAAGDIEESLQPILALRLLVHSDADVWALLSEILIQV
ncbi:alpha-1,3-mannosyl-glycoprotein 4-beta-N-acetylglucosaminyltransferase B-like isoform X2 [Pseudochaenichthys georgianus]|uniref:alpha-1,3-mannosyl-glycoprotein 4-beta-N-acetylglucosaminyltransferase B-like isoform X2 n=1 Tax=Pseudochaenichthys georgianus TaxID=52239 RepID=UPI0039C4CB7D